jgi:hypothetical protein
MLVILVRKSKDYAGCVASNDMTLIPKLVKSLSVGGEYFSGEGEGKLMGGWTQACALCLN